jgi:hypothetical protein
VFAAVACCPSHCAVTDALIPRAHAHSWPAHRHMSTWVACTSKAHDTHLVLHASVPARRTKAGTEALAPTAVDIHDLAKSIWTSIQAHPKLQDFKQCVGADCMQDGLVC